MESVCFLLYNKKRMVHDIAVYYRNKSTERINKKSYE